jgi:hypothetical protein
MRDAEEVVAKGLLGINAALDLVLEETDYTGLSIDAERTLVLLASVQDARRALEELQALLENMARAEEATVTQ